MAYYKIEGAEEVLRRFDKSPEAVLKLTRKGMSSAAGQVARSMKSRVPSRWKGLVRKSVTLTKKGKLIARAGLVDRSEVSGHQPSGEQDPVFDWYKAYWSNYGTYEGRDPNHTFKKPIKRSTRAKGSRSRTGIVHKNFFEEASSGWESTFMAAFNKYLKDHANEI